LSFLRAGHRLSLRGAARQGRLYGVADAVWARVNPQRIGPSPSTPGTTTWPNGIGRDPWDPPPSTRSRSPTGTHRSSA